MEIDPLAIEVTKEIAKLNEDSSDNAGSVWGHEDLAQVKIKVLRGHTDSVNSCQFCDHDRKILTSSSDKSIALWDFESGRSLQTYDAGHSQRISKARINNDTNRIVSCGWDKKVNLWDTETGAILWTGEHGGIVICCAFSPDGKMAVTGCDLGHSIKIWDVHNGQLLQELPDLHRKTVTSCNFTPQNDRIITTSMDKTAKFYDLKSRSITIALEGHTNFVSDASLSSDERKLATVGWDKNIKYWDVSTGSYRSKGPVTIEKAHEGCISSCQFSQDGLEMVTGGYDLTVSVWDVENAVQKLRLQGHDDWVEDVDFSQDRKWLVSCSKDKTVRLWNVEDTDNIPFVMEQRKAIGLNVFKCVNCGKPFSVAELKNLKDVAYCVFCRLQPKDET